MKCITFAIIVGLTVSAQVSAFPVPKPNPLKHGQHDYLVSLPTNATTVPTLRQLPLGTAMTMGGGVPTGLSSNVLQTTVYMTVGPRDGHMRKFWRLTKFDHDLDANANNRPYTISGPLFDDRSDCAIAISDVSRQNNTGDGLFCAVEWKWVKS